MNEMFFTDFDACLFPRFTYRSLQRCRVFKVTSTALKVLGVNPSPWKYPVTPMEYKARIALK
jgi:hypothetical protein